MTTPDFGLAVLQCYAFVDSRVLFLLMNGSLPRVLTFWKYKTPPPVYGQWGFRNLFVIALKPNRRAR